MLFQPWMRRLAMAWLRKVAMARGALPVRMREASSPRLTSRG